VRIVLVAPQHPGNIGSAARAMKNMGLKNLVLIAPRAFPHPEATAMASNATDVLDAARVFADLPAALADCPRVFATSARPRYLTVPVSTPREWVTHLPDHAALGPLAILFGRERTGLTNEELDHAQELIVIPTGGEDSSLNLAAAVQVVAYEIQLAAQGLGPAAPAVDKAFPPATHADMERFYVHLEQTLVRTQFLDPGNPRFLMRRLRLLFARALPDTNELNILRGILTSVENTLRRAAVATATDPEKRQ